MSQQPLVISSAWQAAVNFPAGEFGLLCTAYRHLIAVLPGSSFFRIIYLSRFARSLSQA
jgi:hypothetical protein